VPTVFRLVRFIFAATYLLLIAGSIPFSLLCQACSLLPLCQPVKLYPQSHSTVLGMALSTFSLFARSEIIVLFFRWRFFCLFSTCTWALWLLSSEFKLLVSQRAFPLLRNGCSYTLSLSNRLPSTLCQHDLMSYFLVLSTKYRNLNHTTWEQYCKRVALDF
jgi:hypothetical protein